MTTDLELLFSELSKENVADFADFVCGLLKIKTPKIKWESSSQENIGGQTQYEYVNGKFIVNRIILFEDYLPYSSRDMRIRFIETIIHECRHCWQADIYSADLIKDNTLTSDTEVDARAFSYLFLFYFFGVETYVDDDEIRECVEKRMYEINTDFINSAKKYLGTEKFSSIINGL